jgi:hypothetical protein
MTLPLTDAELAHLLRFIGYGRLNAPIWFLGVEEAGGSEDNIRTRLNFEPVLDLAAANRRLGFTKLDGERPVIQRTWRGMCCIMLRLSGHATDTEGIRRYQADRLGRSSGDTLLLELMPLPMRADDDWGYETLIPRYASREAYYAAVKPQRIDAIKNLIAQYLPRVVVAYGKSCWDEYKSLFPNATWSDVGQFRIGRNKNTLAVLTDQFVARTMNDKWDEVAEIIRANAHLGIKHGRIT